MADETTQVGLQEAAQQEAAKQKAEANLKAWDAKMQRAFKGIVPRPRRRRDLQIALDRLDAELEAQKEGWTE